MLYLLPLAASAQVADSVGNVTETVPSMQEGKVIPVNGAFLRQLQERDSILIADQLLYGFELKKVKDGTKFLLPEWKNEGQGGVLVLGTWVLDTLKTTRTRKGQPRFHDIQGSLRITSFDEGIYELPQIAVQRVSEDGVTDTLVFEPLRMDVKTMPIDTVTFVPHDIKGQIRYPLTVAEVLPYLVGGWFAAALVILVVYLLMMYRRKKDPAYERKEPAHIVALRKLDGYRGSKMWVPERQKAFYSGVTDALREYMASRYDISAMEMTTAEIFSCLKSSDVPEELMLAVKELFERSDFVKFAKYVASDEDNASVLPLAVRFVTETYQTELENEEISVAVSGEQRESGNQKGGE